MEKQQIISIINDSKDLIGNNRLREAITKMRQLVPTGKFWKLEEELNLLEETYKYMIHYMIEGADDPKRESLYNDLIENLLRLNDKIKHELLSETTSSNFYSIYNYRKKVSSSIEHALQQYQFCCEHSTSNENIDYNSDCKSEQEKAIKDVFEYIWASLHLSNSEYDAIMSVINNSDDYLLKSQIISALLLGLTECYDTNKIKIFLNIYQFSLDRRLVSRALVSLILSLFIHRDRVASNVEIQSRIKILADSNEFSKEVKNVIFNLIKTRDTDRISKKMKEEIIPEIMKLQPEILNKFKGATTDSELSNMEENPEWEELLNKSGLKDKIKELSDIQMDGGDVFMVAFSNLKNFPFFNYVSNWFLPFSNEHSELESLKQINNEYIFSIIGENSYMCDSDKYSFALSLAKMPESQRNMILSQIDAQFSQLDEDKKTSILSLQETDASLEADKYIRDIYRFFKLYSRRKEFNDPFAIPINFLLIPFIGQLISTAENIQIIGEFYFNRGYYKDAILLFEKQLKLTLPDEQIYQKIGYCYQVEKNTEKALDYYLKAELLNTESKWLIKKIALCYKLLHNYTKAIEYYQRSLEKEPENLGIVMNLGHCLLESGNIDEALKCYYKVEYLDDNSNRAWRPIAWCEFIKSNYDKSEIYYNKILASQPTSQDYLNAGHLALVVNQRKKAIELYKQSIIKDNYNAKVFLSNFNNDKEYLLRGGINSNDLPIIIDKLLYELEITSII